MFLSDSFQKQENSLFFLEKSLSLILSLIAERKGQLDRQKEEKFHKLEM